MSASLNSILANARSGLLSQQIALQVTSHNMANATTEGFSRQRADLVPGVPIQMPEGLLGTGVRVADITRARNTLLDGVFRRDSSLFHGFETRHSALRSVESLFGEPGDLGLGANLDAFWNAWSDLSNDPLSSTARGVVVARGQEIASQFKRIDAALDAVSNQVQDGLRVGMDEVNRILSDIAGLNADIAASRAYGTSAPDLADARDRLLDQLATYVPVATTPRDSGAVGVTVNGVSVVEGIYARNLSLQTGPGGWTVQTDTGSALSLTTGAIGGAIEVLNDDFVSFRSQLDALARGLVERVNAIHGTGTNAAGATGVSFFDDFGDPTLVTARNLSLSAAVLADPGAVAAGTPDGSGNYRPGANDVALALSALRDDASGGVLAGRSVNDAYRDLAASVALSTSAAREAEDNHRVLMSAASERRESVSGVATDEELVKIVQIQAAYTAASRLVSVVDEMYQALLTI